MILGRDEPGLRRAWYTFHSDWMLTVSVPEPCVKMRAGRGSRTVAMSMSRFEVEPDSDDDLRYTVHVTMSN
jgi:hypothetical protein